jgi:very-short-patch-repair endonuclease
VNLYGDAQRVARGRHAVVTSADLPITMNAARWRASHDQGVARPYRGVYLIGPTGVDLLDRARAALAVTPGAVIGFDTAAALLGFGVFGSDTVHLVVPAGGRFPQRRGISAHQSILPIEPWLVRGVPCTPAARTAIDLARVLSRRDGLSILDAALAQGVCDPDQLIAESLLHQRLKGCLRAQELAPLADGRAQCVQESHLRLILHDAGLDSFEPQVPVWDGGEWPRYLLDLADVRRKVAAEYDGASHLDRDRMSRDRKRHNYLEGIGWRMRYFTSDDLYRRPSEVVRIVKAALARS